jgi:hypothetical protein
MKRIVLLVFFMSLCACSAEQVYSSAQNWQRNACDKLADRQDRERCSDKANTSYDSYKQNTP